MNTPPSPTRTRCLAALAEEGPMSINDLAKYLGMRRGTVNSSMSLTKAVRPKVVYIKAWDRSLNTSGGIKALFAVGNRADAPKPNDMPASERNLRYRAKHSATINLRRRARRGKAVPVWINGLL